MSLWFERRARQMRRNQVFANCLAPAVGLMLLLSYLAPPLGARSHLVNTSIGVPLATLVAVSIFANASVFYGIERCPSSSVSLVARGRPG
jgi:hypothetical protein